MTINDDGNFVPQRHYDVVNDFSGVTVQKIRNPLVVSLIIQDYSQKEFAEYGFYDLDINGVIEDHYNIAQLNCKHGYHQLYLIENTIENKSQIKHFINVQSEDYKDDQTIPYKLSFIADEIDKFNDSVIENVLNEDNDYDYDGLIYFIGGHGAEDDQLITSSPNDTYYISEIYEKYTNKNCPCLRNKPKIFFIDMERGSLQNPKDKKKLIKMPQAKTQEKKEQTKINAVNTNKCTTDPDSTEFDLNGDTKNSNDTKNNDEKEDVQERPSIKKFYQDEEDMRFIYSCAKGFKGNLRFEQFNMASILFGEAVKTISESIEKKRSLDDTITQIKYGIDKDIQTILTTQEITSIEDTNRIHDQIIFRSRSKKWDEKNNNNTNVKPTLNDMVNSVPSGTSNVDEKQVNQQQQETENQLSTHPQLSADISEKLSVNRTQEELKDDPIAKVGNKDAYASETSCNDTVAKTESIFTAHEHNTMEKMVTVEGKEECGDTIVKSEWSSLDTAWITTAAFVVCFIAVIIACDLFRLQM